MPPYGYDYSIKNYSTSNTNNISYNKDSFKVTELELLDPPYSQLNDDFFKDIQPASLSPASLSEVLDKEINRMIKELDYHYLKEGIQMYRNKLPMKYYINKKKNTCVLLWNDDTKTIVKKSRDDKFDKRLAFLTAYFQKHCGMSKTKANEYLDNLEVIE